MILYGAFLALMAAAALADVTRLRIPNPLNAAVALLFAVPAVAHPEPALLGWHAAAGAATLAVGLVLFALGLMGGGDVKLFAATALWTGLDLLLVHVVLVALLGLAVLGVLLVARGAVRLLAPQDAGPLTARLPASLATGAGVPYGVAIAASAALLADRFPETFWVF